MLNFIKFMQNYVIKNPFIVFYAINGLNKLFIFSIFGPSHTRKAFKEFVKINGI